MHAERADTLTWEQAMALTLAVHRGLTYRQIAHRLGLAEHEAARLIRQALFHVRAFIAV